MNATVRNLFSSSNKATICYRNGGGRFTLALHKEDTINGSLTVVTDDSIKTYDVTRVGKVANFGKMMRALDTAFKGMLACEVIEALTNSPHWEVKLLGKVKTMGSTLDQEDEAADAEWDSEAQCYRYCLERPPPMRLCYTVLQYAPDLLTDEKINFGIVVVGIVGNDSVFHRYQFLDEWENVVRWFSGEGDDDTDLLREFIFEITGASKPLTYADLHQWWDDSKRNVIQATYPLPSTEASAEVLLPQLVDRFLKKRAPLRV